MRVGSYLKKSVQKVWVRTDGMIDRMFDLGNDESGDEEERGGVSAFDAALRDADADAVARRFGVRGPVTTCGSACAAGAMALESALDAMHEGWLRVALDSVVVGVRHEQDGEGRRAYADVAVTSAATTSVRSAPPP